MGWWQVDADTLARSRFVLSPFAETFASLKLLHAGVGAHPGERDWLRAHLPGYRALLAADPVTALIVRSGLGPEWIADFLTPTPLDGESFEDGVARVGSASPEAARAHLAMSLGGPLPAGLDRDDLPRRAAGLLRYVWEETVRPDWERRRRILEADVVARTVQVSRSGWAAVLDSLRPGTRWLGESRFQVNRQEYPPREISGAELVFVPVTPRTGWVSWEERERYAVVYPCTGVLAESSGRLGGRGVPSGLGALVGGARAGVLVLLGAPMSTSQLVAVTGQGLGSVGRHLRVLLDAGLVERGRAGRAVLYVRTAAGDVLVEAAGAGSVGR
ncbi:winged helix-turn-helix domain-containing protein [Streptomyces sp. NPDC000983]|uniref:ArsR/SmtB family transcription factor n=1 Tax=Streptomyces sp. NPDC000983 TaxID=3154373 RepID=UPI00332DA70A